MFPAMRLLPLLLLIGLAGCAGDPRSLGLTGAAAPQFPPEPGENSGAAATPTTGARYDPSAGPNTGSGKFWGYN